MHTSISRRINNIKKLTIIYYKMDYGSLIEKPDELLRVFDIRGSKSASPHPHKGMRVYISRKSLKHFVESRKYQLQKRHTEEQIILKIKFAINNLRCVITDFDDFQIQEDNSCAYSKNLIGASELRVIIQHEKIQNRLELVSIHFRKNRK